MKLVFDDNLRLPTLREHGILFLEFWTEVLEVTIAKKDRANSGTSRVQEVQQLLPKSKAQKKCLKSYL